MPEGPAKDAFIAATNAGLVLHGHGPLGQNTWDFQPGVRQNPDGEIKPGMHLSPATEFKPCDPPTKSSFQKGHDRGFDWNSPELTTRERKDGKFYMQAINLCVDFHLRGSRPQTLGRHSGRKDNPLDRYGAPAWMELKCDVRALLDPYRIGLCKIVGVRIVDTGRSDSPFVPKAYSFDVNCNGEVEEWPSMRLAVESGVINSPDHVSLLEGLAARKRRRPQREKSWKAWG